MRSAVLLTCLLILMTGGVELPAGDAIEPRVPTDKELARAIFENIEAESFQLRKARFRNERINVKLLRDRTLRGDLNQDGVDDAAVFLSATTGGERRRLWLSAITGRYGHPASYGSALIGHRMELLEARIADGQIQLKIAEYGRGDVDCPTQLWDKQWAVMDGSLKLTGAQMVGKRECPAAD